MLLQNLNKVGNILGILPAGHEKPVEEKEQAREEAAQEPSEPLVSHPARVSLPQEEEFPLENPEKLARLEQEESAGSPELLWEAFRKRYPKIQAFDSPGTIEILTIRPQDIGLLPRENWTYGNNSFLLHGYYNYRYLVFARVGDEARKRVRYILGVPGPLLQQRKIYGFHVRVSAFCSCQKTAGSKRPVRLLVCRCQYGKYGLTGHAWISRFHGA